MRLWLIILGMVFVTYSVRLSVIALIGQRELPATFRRALRFVPPTALTAIIFPEVFMPSGTIDLSWNNERLLAALVAVLIAWRVESLLLAIGAGMVTLWGLMALM